MESMHSLFDKAKKEWREKVCEHFPIRANTKVIKKVEPIKRNWSFATDFKQIFVNISNDENLKEKFENVVAKYWKGNPENLAKETMVYLLWHELYHPIEAHFSEEDKKKN